MYMDNAKLVNAIKNGFSRSFEDVYFETFEILCSYLRSTMRADVPDAEECAQHALVKTMERVQQDAIRDPDRIYSYMLQSAKNRYLRLRYEQNRSNFQDDMEAYAPIDEQIDALVSRDEENALEECLDHLPEESRTFIDYWLEFPDSRASDVAEQFRISVNNVWTRKHRILKKLSDCIGKKLNQ